MSQSAPVPEGPAMPTGSIRVSPSRHNRVSGQGQQDGQLVRSSVQSFILSVILQNNPNFHDYEPSTLPLKNDNWPGYHLKPVDQIWLVWNLIFLKYQTNSKCQFYSEWLPVVILARSGWLCSCGVMRVRVPGWVTLGGEWHTAGVCCPTPWQARSSLSWCWGFRAVAGLAWRGKACCWWWCAAGGWPGVVGHTVVCDVVVFRSWLSLRRVG